MVKIDKRRHDLEGRIIYREKANSGEHWLLSKYYDGSYMAERVDLDRGLTGERMWLTPHDLIGDYTTDHMAIKVLIVEPNKAPYQQTIIETQMHNIVGGWLETCMPPSHDDWATIICNEEGKIRELPMNRVIKTLAGNAYDVICGTFIIANALPEDEDFTSLTDEQIKKYSEMYA